MLQSIEQKSSGFACVVAFAAAVVLVGFAIPASAGSAKISEAIGEVEIGRGSPPRFTPASAGDAVTRGDVVRTGRGGRVELVLQGSTVRVYENSLLRIPADPADDHQIEMERGRSIFDVIQQAVGRHFEIRTPEVVVSVKGTRFEVDLRGDLAEVAVFRGTVGVRAPEAALDLETLVREGFAALGAPDVPFELDWKPRADPWDSWANLDDSRETALGTDRREREKRLQQAARTAARRSTAKELVGLASERNPEVAARVARMHRERLAARTQGDGDGAAPPASPARSQEEEVARKGGSAMGLQDRAARLEMDREDVAKLVEENRVRKLELNSGTLEGDATGDMVDLPDDPVETAGGASSWDPTPELPILEVAALGLPVSYLDLIETWYKAVEDIQVNAPQVLVDATTDSYRDALVQKFIDAGMKNSAARSIADYIVSKIDH